MTVDQRDKKDKNKNKKPVNNNQKNINHIKSHVDELSSLKKRIKELETENKKLEDRFNGEFLQLIEKKSREAGEILKKKEEKLKKKYEDEFSNLKDYLYQKQFTNLVEILSQFEMVLKMPVSSDEVKNYLAGFKMFSSQFNELLRSLNIEEIIPKKGDSFDSETMIAISTDSVGDKLLENKVLEVFSSGYKLNKRIIKLSSVKVGLVKD